MPRFRPEPSELIPKQIKGEEDLLLARAAFDRFNSSVLGLGDIKAKSESTEALAAVFDLGGFTNFCKQIDPHLSVPKFLSAFLDWLLGRLREEMVVREHPEGIQLYSPLPFLVKFMGDGVLVLWDCEDMSPVSIRNVIHSASVICGEYSKTFYPAMAKRVVEPPLVLRCGLARGTVFSVGSGDDFVGSCINMAARLQKLPGLGFSFNTRGVDLEGEKVSDFFTQDIVLTEVAIRGIGERELVGVRKSEFARLDAKDKACYRLV